MKKLFLTSGLVLCMACPAFADLTAMPTTSENESCVTGVLGSDVGPVDIEAVWSPTPYQITFVKGSDAVGTSTISGNNPSAVAVTVESTNVALPAPQYSATGYHFKGWKAAHDVVNNTAGDTDYIGTAGANYNDDYSPATLTAYTRPASTEMTVIMEANHYTVTYAAGTHSTLAGTAVTETATYDAGYTPLTFANSGVNADTGYHFVKWSGDYTTTGTQTATDYAAGTEFTYQITNGLTLTSVMAANETTVNYACTGTDVGGTAPANGTAIYGESFTFAARACTKEGYTQTGWVCTGANGTSGLDALYTVEQTVNSWAYTGAHQGTITCVPDFTVNEIRITWYGDTSANDGVAFTPQQGAESCTYGGAITLPTNLPDKAGYTFQKWQVRQSTTVEPGTVEPENP